MTKILVERNIHFNNELEKKELKETENKVEMGRKETVEGKVMQYSTFICKRTLRRTVIYCNVEKLVFAGEQK